VESCLISCLIQDTVLFSCEFPSITHLFYPLSCLILLLILIISSYTLQYPELLVSCQKKVGGFLLSDERRHRNRVINLGEFLILLSLVEVHWGAFLSVFIPEMLQRCWPT